MGADSPLAGHRLADTPLAAQKKLRLIEVRRSGNRVEASLHDLVFEAGDRVTSSLYMRASSRSTNDASTANVSSIGLGELRSTPAWYNASSGSTESPADRNSR